MRFIREAKANPIASKATAETVRLGSTRIEKATVARDAFMELDMAMRACDWPAVQKHTQTINQMARWLQLKQEDVERFA